jgi:uncharacterized membrane protein YbjE (DUF340 family)
MRRVHVTITIDDDITTEEFGAALSLTMNALATSPRNVSAQWGFENEEEQMVGRLLPDEKTKSLPVRVGSLLGELGETIEQSDQPRDMALIALTFVLGMAVRAGWTREELMRQPVWPR